MERVRGKYYNIAWMRKSDKNPALSVKRIVAICPENVINGLIQEKQNG